MIEQGAALAGAVTAIHAIYKASCILECGQSLTHLSGLYVHVGKSSDVA